MEILYLGQTTRLGLQLFVSAVEELLSDPDASYGDIRIAFTPDEEIGKRGRQV